jgi:exopolysaccharide biosynthesis WecB/TagA/CpsF family protein
VSGDCKASKRPYGLDMGSDQPVSVGEGSEDVHHIFVGGVKAVTASRKELTRLIVSDCIKDRRSAPVNRTRLMFDVNGHAISLAARDADFEAALKTADVVHADGEWVVIASRFLSGAAISERSGTTDLIHDVIRAGLTDRLSHYLLGGSEEVNAACAERLQQIHPGIVIAGRRNGYFPMEEEHRVIAEMNAAKPDIVWIGLGKPREQLFAVSNREQIRASWTITCGGCFNFITGHYHRAPRWMQRLALEWLFRVVTTPKLFWRYATTSPHAIWLALTRIDRTLK